jgi:hypothetical protein
VRDRNDELARARGRLRRDFIPFNGLSLADSRRPPRIKQPKRGLARNLPDAWRSSYVLVRGGTLKVAPLHREWLRLLHVLSA